MPEADFVANAFIATSLNVVVASPPVNLATSPPHAAIKSLAKSHVDLDSPGPGITSSIYKLVPPDSSKYLKSSCSQVVFAGNT